jgi:hypothetical protein
LAGRNKIQIQHNSNNKDKRRKRTRKKQKEREPGEHRQKGIIFLTLQRNNRGSFMGVKLEKQQLDIEIDNTKESR